MNISLLIHILAGSLALLTGTLVLIIKKGTTVHKLLGHIFLVSMLVVGTSAVVMAVKNNNIVLLVIAVFSTYMVTTGKLSGNLKASNKRTGIWYIWLSVSVAMLLAVIGMLILAIILFSKGNLFAIVLLTFAGISLGMLWQDYKYLIKRKTKGWLPIHISRMVGALIAAYTALLVVNVTATVIPGFVLWLLPSIPGTVFIVYHIRKVTPLKVKG